MKKQNDRMFKNQYFWATLCALITFGFAYAMMYPGHGWGGDFSQYIAQTKALLTGTVQEWYEKNGYIIEHSFDGLGADVYPWGFPLLLVPVYLIFGESIVAFKIFEIVLLSISTFVLVLYFKNKMPLPYAVIMAFMIGLNPAYLKHTDAVLSDIPCMLFSIMAVWFTQMHLVSKNKHLRNGILCGVFVFLATYIRTMALCLLLALVVIDSVLGLYWLFWKKRGKDPGKMEEYYQMKWYWHIVPYGVYGLLHVLMNSVLIKSGGTYWNYFDFSFERIQIMYELYLPCLQDVLGSFSCVLSILILIGVIYSFKKELYLMVYVSGMIVMLLVYPHYQGERFFFSVFPFLYLFAYMGAAAICVHIKDRLIQGIFIGIAISMVVLYGKECTDEIIPFRKSIEKPIEAYSQDAEAVYAYINMYVTDDSVVYFFKPRVLYLMTNVYSYSKGDNIDALQQADYVLISRHDDLINCKNYLAENTEYVVDYSNATFILYRALNK